MVLVLTHPTRSTLSGTNTENLLHKYREIFKQIFKTGEMALDLTHLTRSTLWGTNMEARWLGLSGVFIAMVRGNYFGNFDNDDNCNDNDDKDGNGSYDIPYGIVVQLY